MNRRDVLTTATVAEGDTLCTNRRSDAAAQFGDGLNQWRNQFLTGQSEVRITALDQDLVRQINKSYDYFGRDNVQDLVAGHRLIGEHQPFDPEYLEGRRKVLNVCWDLRNPSSKGCDRQYGRISRSDEETLIAFHAPRFLIGFRKDKQQCFIGYRCPDSYDGQFSENDRANWAHQTVLNLTALTSIATSVYVTLACPDSGKTSKAVEMQEVIAVLAKH